MINAVRYGTSRLSHTVRSESLSTTTSSRATAGMPAARNRRIGSAATSSPASASASRCSAVFAGPVGDRLLAQRLLPLGVRSGLFDLGARLGPAVGSQRPAAQLGQPLRQVVDPADRPVVFAFQIPIAADQAAVVLLAAGEPLGELGVVLEHS